MTVVHEKVHELGLWFIPSRYLKWRCNYDEQFQFSLLYTVKTGGSVYHL
jgi:hypothetical protein